MHTLGLDNPSSPALGSDTLGAPWGAGECERRGVVGFGSVVSGSYEAQAVTGPDNIFGDAGDLNKIEPEGDWAPSKKDKVAPRLPSQNCGILPPCRI